MSFYSKFKSMGGAFAVASVALTGLVSPAIAQDHSAFLEYGETTTVEAYLMEDEAVYATCDADCSDIDMTLYTELGVEVASDFELDDYPVVTAPFEGTFLIEVSMADCDSICEVSVSSELGF